ncbi:MAG: sarcosine oxidase subunit alpha family protein, partial [Hyphomicrobiales bacterium]
MPVKGQKFRLAEGGLIDRSDPVGFTFDNTRFQGYRGDTLASALIANGVRLVGRSFKYHRPRGIYTAGSFEPNALVELRSGARREPNSQATTVELYDGLDAQSQNRWPGLRYDLMAVNSRLSPFLAAGFYYKTFMWPRRFWTSVYEPFIRRAAGLGRAATENDPDRYERAYAHCDVLVVGAGPAGLMAAEAAAAAGARVILCEEGPRLGGSLLSERIEIDGSSGPEWAREVEGRLDGAGVRVMTRTAAVGWYDGNTFAALKRVADHLTEPPAHLPRQKLWRIAARQVVIATGAQERPLVFPDNDRPGVMLASAARTYVNRYAAKPGTRAVIVGNNGGVAATAEDLTRAGIDIAAIIDPANVAGIEGEHVFPEFTVTGLRGGRRVKGVRFAPVGGGGAKSVRCDLVCVAGGWNPCVHLVSQRGIKPVWDGTLQGFVPPERTGDGFVCAGAARGLYATADCLEDGDRAGIDAAKAAGSDGVKSARAPLSVAGPEQGKVAAAWPDAKTAGKAFVDLQNDVTVKDVALAAREGYVSVEHLKRYTTLGMATDQGKMANVTGLAVLAAALDKKIPQVGTTTFRPPYVPVSLGALAGHASGRTYRPVRRSAFHDWAAEQGARFIEAGLWMRWHYFPEAGEGFEDAVAREVHAVRNRAGFCDVSTLGKIELQGPDAVELLNRVYTGSFTKLPVGRSRYGLMLREDGIVFDDGTVTRLGDDRFFITTTTGEAGPVMEHLEYCHQVLWPKLDLSMVSVSDAWAGLAVAGPNARDVLQALVDEQDLSNEAFPFLSAAELTVCNGVPARLMRISFSGELAYELYVPYRYGDAVVRALAGAGALHGIVPYGLGALGVMRIEKGHVAGSEINGLATGHDLGLGWMVTDKKEGDYIGRVLKERYGLVDVDRQVLVGLKPVKPKERIFAGAHLLAKDTPTDGEHDEGYVTAAAWSPTLETHIALGFLKRGRRRHGEVIRAANPLQRQEVLVEVVDPVFYD